MAFEKWFSTPIANVIWGMVNFVTGYLLIFSVGDFSVAHTFDVMSVILGFAVCSIFLSWSFGRVNFE